MIYKADCWLILHKKYKSSGLSGSREDLFLLKIMTTPLGHGLIEPQVHSRQNLQKGLLVLATHTHTHTHTHTKEKKKTLGFVVSDEMLLSTSKFIEFMSPALIV